MILGKLLRGILYPRCFLARDGTQGSATASLSAIFRLDLWISTFILVEDRSQLESRTTALAKPKLNHVGHVDPLLYPRDILPS
jgi:hypothetical protein